MAVNLSLPLGRGGNGGPANEHGARLMDSFGDFGGTIVVAQEPCAGIPFEDERSSPQGLQRHRESSHQGRESWPTVEQFLSMSEEELGRVDPLVMNLVVAKAVPALTDLDIGRYVQMADAWAADFRAQMPAMEQCFLREPHLSRNDIDLFFVGMVFRYVTEVLGVRYREDQTNVHQILYTDPSEVFLNGVMDTRQGNCGTMALLYVIFGRRVGMPLYLVRVWSHFLCRFDNGAKQINMDAAVTGPGEFCIGTDEDFLAKFNLPAKAKECGSDMHSLTARQLLATFLGMRGRHFRNTPHFFEAERDYLLARYLFPENRDLYLDQSGVSIQCASTRFEPNEDGYPVAEARRLVDYARWNNGLAPGVPTEAPTETVWRKEEPKERKNGRSVDAVFQQTYFA